MKTPRVQNKEKVQISKATILRAVASSSALESNQSTLSIQNKLEAKSGRFSHLKLAL